MDGMTPFYMLSSVFGATPTKSLVLDFVLDPPTRLSDSVDGRRAVVSLACPCTSTLRALDASSSLPAKMVCSSRLPLCITKNALLALLG